MERGDFRYKCTLRVEKILSEQEQNRFSNKKKTQSAAASEMYILDDLDSGIYTHVRHDFQIQSHYKNSSIKWAET